MEEEEFKISKKEADQLREAFKKPEFCKLLAEYAQEISDPENKKKYEEELVALEKQRGVDMKYIHPQPGFVMKAFLKPEGTRKLFINMCSSDVIDPATSKAQNKGHNWNIPYSLTPPRDDLDKAKNKCTVVDVIFHTEIFKRAKEESRFKQLLIDSALEGLQKQLNLVVDRDKIVYLHMPYKGVPSPAVLRTRSKGSSDNNIQENPNPLNIPFPPLREETNGSNTLSNSGTNKEPGKSKVTKKKEQRETEPKYTVIHRGEFSMQDFTYERHSSAVRRPKELVVRVEVPGVKSATSMNVEIFEKRVLLQCKSPRYRLDLPLAYPVDDEHSKAKFETSTHILTLILPVLPPPTPPPPQPGPSSTVTAAPSGSDVIREEETSEERTECVAQADEVASAITGNDNTHVPNGDTSPGQVGKPEKLVSTSLDSSCVDKETESEETSAVVEHARGDDHTVHYVNGIAPSGQQGDSISVEWSSSKRQRCPPFSYRQDTGTVVFCLHTPGVKEGSIVKLFNPNSIQLTYSTDTEFFSFFVSFPEECVLDVDDCMVDVSLDNLVLLLKKEEGEEFGKDGDIHSVWGRCQVGPHANHTEEKLFLTDANVQSEIHSLPDPWMASHKQSEGATATAKLVGEEVVVTISDPAQTSPAMSLPPGENSGDVAQTHKLATSDLPEGGTKECTNVRPGDQQELAFIQSDIEGDRDQYKCAEVETASQEVLSNKAYTDGSPEVTTTASTTANSAATTPSVTVEADGSVFVHADENYLKERDSILPLIEGKGDKETLGNQLKLSNDLLYSLD